MNPTGTSRRRSSHRPAGGLLCCPSCGRQVKPEANWCAGCNFTGADTIEMFPGDPPPLLPVLDIAEILTEPALSQIHAERERLTKRFPQFRWRICTICLPAEKSLPLFGFWMLNACPLDKNESESDRRWTVLLLVNSATGKAAVVTGYAAEPYLSDDEWKSVMSDMLEPWQANNPGTAITQFLRTSRKHLERAWKRYGLRDNPGSR